VYIFGRNYQRPDHHPGAAVSPILPSRHQAALPLDRLILSEAPAADATEMDVTIVGAGPAGLACAIELARLAKKDQEAGGNAPDLNIAVLEKAESLGEHNLSGAVINPRALRELFPDLEDANLPFRQHVDAESVYFLTERRALRIPTPPSMHNRGYYTASICELVRWLGERAEELGVNLFAGFPVDSLLVEGQRVRGVRTAPAGRDRDGTPGSAFVTPTDITSRVTVIADGTRSLLGQAYREWQKIPSPNPQIFALGVKEVWEVPHPLDRVIHTLGWPLPTDAFGGSFMYPLGQTQVALGLVVGLDYHRATLDVHELLQRMKLHPIFRPHLEGGKLLEWGAKTIPEGGFYSLPERRHGDGILTIGDAAGFVDVPSLKGIHYAIQSGIYAARTIFAGLRAGDTSAAALAPYDRLVDQSYIVADMRRSRNMRLAFKDGLYLGGLKAGLMAATGGRFPGGMIRMPADADVPRNDGAAAPFVPDNVLTFSKLDAVFKSANATRDTIPSHLIVGQDVGGEVAEFYTHVCPAGVYERVGDELRVNAPNCVDCKATDVLGPRWTPREAGSGPKYRLM
jgi:electron-transferring-flavoprotein dehydrogenase